MEFLGDVLGRYQPLKKSARSERAELIRFFAEQITDKKGDLYKPAFIAIRLSHYTVDQLYGLKSGFSDRLRREDTVAAQKWWWFTTKTTNKP